MKRTFNLVLLFAVLTTVVYAQQRPQYTQYVFNNYLLNPAVTGIENYTDIKANNQGDDDDYRGQTYSLSSCWPTYFLELRDEISQ